ncbi:MAG TPA: polymer-forming cytoskeletal protein [Candidatus Polarisedimenticolia bacterium]|nr:polymer-forming cytoskeletal protein [Candidatus Polarisedimenticolia bacterium]
MIGSHTRFRGEITGGGSLTIRGQVEGAISLRDGVSVESGAHLRANVTAIDLTVRGVAQGEMTILGTLTLRSSAVVEGAVEMTRFRMEEGAVLNGSVRRRVETVEVPSHQSSS